MAGLFFLKAIERKRDGDYIWEEKISFKRLVEKKEPRSLKV